MRIWLELNKEEADKVYEFVKGNFSVESRTTAVMGEAPKGEKVTQVVEPQAPVVNAEEPQAPVVNAEEPQAPVVTIEEIREVLIKKRKAGKGKQVAELVKSYGVNALPDVDPKHFSDLLKRAEGL